MAGSPRAIARRPSGAMAKAKIMSDVNCVSWLAGVPSIGIRHRFSTLPAPRVKISALLSRSQW
jgi:hypothetical protein